MVLVCDSDGAKKIKREKINSAKKQGTRKKNTHKQRINILASIIRPAMFDSGKNVFGDEAEKPSCAEDISGIPTMLVQYKQLMKQINDEQRKNDIIAMSNNNHHNLNCQRLELRIAEINNKEIMLDRLLDRLNCLADKLIPQLNHQVMQTEVGPNRVEQVQLRERSQQIGKGESTFAASNQGQYVGYSNASADPHSMGPDILPFMAEDL
jgi:hypothetical protein